MRLQGYVLTTATAAMFGLGTVLTKQLVGELPSLTLTSMALLGGGLVLAVVMILRRASLVPRIPLRQWVNLLLLALLGTALPLALVAAGFAQTTAIKGSFLMQLGGVAALLFAVLLLGERLNRRHALGIAILLLGSALMVWPAQGMATQGGLNMGDLLIVLGAIGMGYGFAPSKQLAAHAPAMQISMVRLLIGGVALLPFALLRDGAPLLPTSTAGMIAFPLLIVTNYSLAYLTMQAGLGLLQAWESAAILQSVPLFSALFAVLVLHDSLGFTQLLGAALIVFGGLTLNVLGNSQPAPRKLQNLA